MTRPWAARAESLPEAAIKDAARYAFAKTLVGQVVTIGTFRRDGAASLDQALDEAMAAETAGLIERVTDDKEE